MIARQKCRLFIISVSIYISWPTDVAIAPTSGYRLSFSMDAATFLKPVFCISLCSINAPSALVCRLDDDQDSVPEPTPGRGTNVCLRVTHVYESHPSPRTSRVSHGTRHIPPTRVSSVCRRVTTCNLGHVTPCVWSTVRTAFHPPSCCSMRGLHVVTRRHMLCAHEWVESRSNGVPHGVCDVLHVVTRRHTYGKQSVVAAELQAVHGKDSACVQAIGHTAARVALQPEQQKYAITGWQSLMPGNLPCEIKGLIRTLTSYSVDTAMLCKVKAERTVLHMQDVTCARLHVVTRRHTLLTRVGGMWRVPCDTREVRGLGCDSYTWVTRRHTSVTRPGVDSGTES